MLRGNRRVILAVVGFVIAVLGLGSLIAWVLWPGSPHLPTYGWEETAESDYQPGGASCQPAEINRLRTDRERSRKREACEETAEQHRIQTNDLKQQTRAADAAAAAVWIAEWQSKATVFGLIIGFYTLAAATAAAIFAKQAADETRRGVTTAQAAVAETKRIGEAQVRCYLSVGNVVIELHSSGVITFQMVVSNSGQSPAKELRWDWRISMREINTGVLWKSPDIQINPDSAGISVSAGERKSTYSIKADLISNSQIRNQMVDSTKLICDLRVDLEWKDIFDNIFRERARFTADFKPGDNFGKPVAAERYTAYTEEKLSKFRAHLSEQSE